MRLINLSHEIKESWYLSGVVSSVEIVEICTPSKKRLLRSIINLSLCNGGSESLIYCNLNDIEKLIGKSLLFLVANSEIDGFREALMISPQ